MSAVAHSVSHFRLDDRVIVVTGAARGIGKAISELIIAMGGRVVGIDVNDEGLAANAATYPGHFLPVTGSIADPAFATFAVERAVKEHGNIDGLVNNAGIVRTAMIEKMAIADWQAVIDVNLSGSFYLLQAVGRHLIERAKAGNLGSAGSIVNIGSDAGRRGTIGQINYGAAKAAQFGLTMSAAREWAKYPIRVNTVMFGVVETDMTEAVRSDKFRDTYLAQIPMGRFATAEEVAQPVCFLLSDAASYITGQHLSVNGGFHISV